MNDYKCLKILILNTLKVCNVFKVFLNKQQTFVIKVTVELF